MWCSDSVQKTTVDTAKLPGGKCSCGSCLISQAGGKCTRHTIADSVSGTVSLAQYFAVASRHGLFPCLIRLAQKLNVLGRFVLVPVRKGRAGRARVAAVPTVQTKKPKTVPGRNVGVNLFFRTC
jgi:hypothetical protein